MGVFKDRYILALLEPNPRKIRLSTKQMLAFWFSRKNVTLFGEVLVESQKVFMPSRFVIRALPYLLETHLSLYN